MTFKEHVLNEEKKRSQEAKKAREAWRASEQKKAKASALAISRAFHAEFGFLVQYGALYTGTSFLPVVFIPNCGEPFTKDGLGWRLVIQKSGVAYICPDTPPVMSIEEFAFLFIE